MKNEVFKTVIEIKPDLDDKTLYDNFAHELEIISPVPLSETSLLLVGHNMFMEHLKQDESSNALHGLVHEENDSIHHVRLKDQIGILKLNILKKNELLTGLSPNVNIIDLIEEVRLFAPSSEPNRGYKSYGIEFTFRNVLKADARDHVDDSRVYGIVTFHVESQTLDIHCNDFIDNDFSEFDSFKDLIKGYAEVFFNHPTIPFSEMITGRLDIFSYPAQNPDYIEVLKDELHEHFNKLKKLN